MLQLPISLKTGQLNIQTKVLRQKLLANSNSSARCFGRLPYQQARGGQLLGSMLCFVGDYLTPLQSKMLERKMTHCNIIHFNSPFGKECPTVKIIDAIYSPRKGD